MQVKTGKNLYSNAQIAEGLISGIKESLADIENFDQKCLEKIILSLEPDISKKIIQEYR